MMGSETSELVTMNDVYSEISTAIRSDSFKCRPTTKLYAFDPEIPTESEYLELRFNVSAVLFGLA